MQNQPGRSPKELGNTLNPKLVPLVHEAVRRIPRLESVLAEHLADNRNEILPYIFFADALRHLDEFGNDEEWRTLADAVDEWHSRRDKDVDTLIVLEILRDALETKHWPLLRPLVAQELIDELNQLVIRPI